MYGPANTPVTNAKQKDKKILDFPNLQAKAFLFEFFLFSSIEVFHSRFRVFCFVWSYDHDKIDVLFVRVFELLVELIRSIVKIYFDVCIAQIFYHAQIFFLKIFLEVAHQYVRNQIVFYEFEFFQCRKEPVNANRTAHRRDRLSRKHPHQIVIPPATGNRAILRRIRQDNFKNRASIIIKPARQTKINAEIFYPPIEKNFYELGQLTRALVIHKLFLNIIRSLKAKVQNLKQFFSLLSSKAQKRKIFPDLFSPILSSLSIARIASTILPLARPIFFKMASSSLRLFSRIINSVRSSSVNAAAKAAITSASAIIEDEPITSTSH